MVHPRFNIVNVAEIKPTSYKKKSTKTKQRDIKKERNEIDKFVGAF